MPTKPPGDVATHLNVLFNTEFGKRRYGAFRVLRESFRSFTGRERLERGIIRQIAEALLKKYGLLLVEGTEYFGIIKERQLYSLREAPRGVLARQSRRKVTEAKETVLAPQAAWPFHTGAA